MIAAGKDSRCSNGSVHRPSSPKRTVWMEARRVVATGVHHENKAPRMTRHVWRPRGEVPLSQYCDEPNERDGTQTWRGSFVTLCTHASAIERKYHQPLDEFQKYPTHLANPKGQKLLPSEFARS